MKKIVEPGKARRVTIPSVVCAMLWATLLFVGQHSSVSARTVAASAQCGTITERGAQVVEDIAGAQQSAACFQLAYRQGLPAALVLQVTGVDTLRTHTFTLGSEGGSYAIKDSVEFRVVPRPLGPPNVYTCSGLAQTTEGLLISGCGQEGDVLIPLVLPGMPATGHAAGVGLSLPALFLVVLTLVGTGIVLSRSANARRERVAVRLDPEVESELLPGQE